MGPEFQQKWLALMNHACRSVKHCARMPEMEQAIQELEHEIEISKFRRAQREQEAAKQKREQEIREVNKHGRRMLEPPTEGKPQQKREHGGGSKQSIKQENNREHQDEATRSYMEEPKEQCRWY